MERIGVVGCGLMGAGIAEVCAKIGARDRIQAVVFAYEAGLVRPGEPPGVS